MLEEAAQVVASIAQLLGRRAGQDDPELDHGRLGPRATLPEPTVAMFEVLDHPATQ
jgi:hypothetical protein